MTSLSTRQNAIEQVDSADRGLALHEGVTVEARRTPRQPTRRKGRTNLGGQQGQRAPAGHGFAGARHGRVNALNSPVLVGEGSVGLGPGGDKQHHARCIDQRALVRGQDDERHGRGRGNGHVFVAQDDDRGKHPSGQVRGQLLQSAHGRRHHTLNPGGVGVLVGAHQNVVGCTRRLAASVQTLDLETVYRQAKQRMVVFVGGLERKDDADTAGRARYIGPHQTGRFGQCIVETDALAARRGQRSGARVRPCTRSGPRHTSRTC